MPEGTVDIQHNKPPTQPHAPPDPPAQAGPVAPAAAVAIVDRTSDHRDTLADRRRTLQEEQDLPVKAERDRVTDSEAVEGAQW